jgi:hypothetical protein
VSEHFGEGMYRLFHMYLWATAHAMYRTGALEGYRIMFPKSRVHRLVPLASSAAASRTRQHFAFAAKLLPNASPRTSTPYDARGDWFWTLPCALSSHLSGWPIPRTLPSLSLNQAPFSPRPLLG